MDIDLVKREIRTQARAIRDLSSADQRLVVNKFAKEFLNRLELYLREMTMDDTKFKYTLTINNLINNLDDSFSRNIKPRVSIEGLEVLILINKLIKEFLSTDENKITDMTRLIIKYNNLLDAPVDENNLLNRLNIQSERELEEIMSLSSKTQIEIPEEQIQEINKGFMDVLNQVNQTQVITPEQAKEFNDTFKKFPLLKRAFDLELSKSIIKNKLEPKEYYFIIDPSYKEYGDIKLQVRDNKIPIVRATKRLVKI